MSTGPDVSGQPARLRAGDGINMTKAGKSKVAFYSEKPLRKLLGLESQDGPASPVLPTSPETPLAPKSVDRTEPMALNDPNLDGAIELLGATVPTAANASSAAGQVAAPVGRADNFLANAACHGCHDDRRRSDIHRRAVNWFCCSRSQPSTSAGRSTPSASRRSSARPAGLRGWPRPRAIVRGAHRRRHRAGRRSCDSPRRWPQHSPSACCR